MDLRISGSTKRLGKRIFTVGRPIAVGAAAVLLSQVLANCSGVPRTSGQEIQGTDPYSFIVYGVEGRDLRLEVSGNPFPESADEVADVLAAQMQVARVSPGTHITPHPGPSAMDGVRVVLSLSGAARRQAGDEGAISVEASFIFKDKVLTRAAGWVAGVDGVNDPRVAIMMKHVALDLFPGEFDWKP